VVALDFGEEDGVFDLENFSLSFSISDIFLNS